MNESLNINNKEDDDEDYDELRECDFIELDEETTDRDVVIEEVEDIDLVEVVTDNVGRMGHYSLYCPRITKTQKTTIAKKNSHMF